MVLKEWEEEKGEYEKQAFPYQNQIGTEIIKVIASPSHQANKDPVIYVQV